MTSHRRLITLLAALWLVLVPALGAAQPANTPPDDLTRWQGVSTRAEAALDAGRASDNALEDLRAEIVDYRERFLDASEANSTRIDTLQNQIDALGPSPAEGELEPQAIADRRVELNQQLQELLAPNLKAQEAYNQADGLIKEIDRILAERRAEKLLTRGSSPLNPANWGEVADGFVNAGRDLYLEVRRNWRNPVQRAEIQNALPAIAVLLALGALLIARGYSWAKNLGNYMRRFGGRGSGIWSFVVSLGRIILPVAGLFCISEAIALTGLAGARSSQIVAALPTWGAIWLIFRWLSERLFSIREEDALIPLPAERRREMRWYISLLAGLYVLRGALVFLFALENEALATRAVVGFPLVILGALILFRMGQILAWVPRQMEVDKGEDEPRVFSAAFARILSLVGQAARVVAIVTPVVAALGYTQLTTAIFNPFIASLALLGVLVVLQRLGADIYIWAARRDESARDSLIPVLIGMALVLAATPFLALIWGVRPSELRELWVIFNEGFQLGDARISPTDFLAFALVFTLLYMVTRLLQGALKSTVLPKTRIDPGGQNAIVAGIGYVGIFIAGLLAITAAGIDLSALAFIAGALSLGIGFGLQNIVQNFVSGIILLIERPIAEGDWIEVNGNMGYVRDISVRSTRIETFDRTDVIVPNADFVSGTVTNYTRGNTVGRVIVPVGVAYGTDTKRVETILREVAEAHPLVLAVPPPAVIFQGFGADSLDFEIRAILRDVNWVLSVKSDMNHEIARRFVEEGIEIPFAQRDIWLRNPEALAAGGPPRGPDQDKDDSGD